MKQQIKPSILPGFMELSPKEQLIFNEMVNQMIKVYEQNGCMPMDTPIIEKEEILLAKSAGETEKQVYRIENEKNKQALRFDLTVPFARYVVQHMNELAFPFKRYQLGKVYRGERNQKGRYREFYQLDLDIVNPRKLEVTNDAFVMSLAAKAFESIGLRGYRFQVSNRKILSGVLEVLELEGQQSIMRLIDKYDKMGKENCIQEIISLVGEEKCQIINKLLEMRGKAADVIQEMKKYAQQLEVAIVTADEKLREGYKKMLLGISEMEEVINSLSLLGVQEENYSIDLKIMRGLDYYTGTIFETVLEGHANYGSICSGGRYDNLTSLYTETLMPGVGISIGITRLFFVLKEIGFIDKKWLEDKEQYLICPLGNTLINCIKINESLQKQGFCSEVYMNQESLKKQLIYANAKGIRKVIIIGEDELEKGEMLIKDMMTGKQNRVVTYKGISLVEERK